jgi:transcriptional regulator with XRE-family HTH domain
MIDGKRLRELREAHGYSREKFALEIDVGVAQVSRYERGENDVTADILARMARVLSVSSDYLIGLSDQAAPQLNHDLTPDEVAIIAARRRGDLKTAMKALLGDG